MKIYLIGLSETVILRGALEFDGVEGINLLGKIEYGDSTGDGPAGQSRVNALGAPSFASVAGIPGQSFDGDQILMHPLYLFLTGFLVLNKNSFLMSFGIMAAFLKIN